MERIETRMSLPEDVVERVLAMVPFPFVFKAQVLSKTWLARFSPTDKDGVASSFQKRVVDFSANWKTFCPAFVGKDDLIVYDRASDLWRRIPSLSFVSENDLTKHIKEKSHLQVEGALLLVQVALGDLSVANILTRSWRRLPPCPEPDRLQLCHKCLVSHKLSETYKVISLFDDLRTLRAAMIYDSKSCAWRRNEILVSENFTTLSNRMPLSGLDYWVIGSRRMPGGLLVFNFIEEAFKVLQMPPADVPVESDWVYLMECNGSLLMVVRNDDLTVIVVKIDLVSRRWLEVTRGPPAALNLSFRVFTRRPASDGECIFFLGQDCGNHKVVAYNVHKDEWNCFPIPPIVKSGYPYNSSRKEYTWDTPSFQPGLNPFVAA